MTYDTSVLGGHNTSSWSHTFTGDLGILLVGYFNGGGATNPSAIIYNGVSLTRLAQDSDSNASIDLWYLLNPSTGSHTVSMTTTGTNYRGISASYNMVRQTGVPDAYATNPGNVNPITVSPTVLTYQSWLIGVAGVHNATTGNNPLISSTRTDRQASAISDQTAICFTDSNGGVATNLQSTTFTASVTANTPKLYSVMAAIAPVPDGGFFLKMIN
jgi:hypothetical protein